MLCEGGFRAALFVIDLARVECPPCSSDQTVVKVQPMPEHNAAKALQGLAGRKTGGPEFDAVLFDLLTALIDSWTLWNDVAGSDEDGLRWRQAYLAVTYGAGAYRDYETLVGEAAVAAGLQRQCASQLIGRWCELTAWAEAPAILSDLGERVRMGVVTNCSIALGKAAAREVFAGFDVVMTAEQAGFYKPCKPAYAKALEALGTKPGRTLFVAGSAADIPGAAAVGMPVYWHNRIGLLPVSEVAPAYHERDLVRLTQIV